MTGIGLLGVVGLILIVLVLLVWIFAIIRARRNPVLSEHAGGKLKRGPVSGGAIRGDPGQNILTGEAPRQDEDPRESPTDS